ncbi:MAG: HAMP domain-containing protein [Ruminococcus sp.]|nr:HAMP domain-containing protein [Ruminococcus sp.]
MKNKKSSIENKVVSLVFAISFTALLLTSLVAAISIQNITKENDRVTMEMSTQAADKSRLALEKITCDELEALAISKKNQIDILFDGFERELLIFSGAVTEIYVPPVEETTDTEESVDGTVGETASLLSISKLLDSMAENNNDKNERKFFFGTESGILMTVGDESAFSSGADFDPRASEWYSYAKENGGFTVSGLDEHGYVRGSMLTCSMPVYGKDGGLIGVVRMDVNIDDFLDSLESSGSDKTNYMVVSSEEKIVFVNDEWRERYSTMGEFLAKNKNDDLHSKLFTRESGSEYIDVGDQQIFASHDYIDDMDWVVVAYVVLDDTLAPSVQIRDGILDFAEKSVVEVKRHSLLLLFMVFGISIIVLLMAFICGTAFARRITGPLKTLTEKVKHVDAEKIKFDCVIDTDDEISDLADAFRNMTDELEKNIAKIKVESKEREKRHAEYNIAKQIQLSVLPTNFREFSNAMEFEVSATIQPAKGVGGDFYDYFKVDKDHIAIIIADVSGKGVPAALFMMISKILMDTRTKSGISTGEILGEVNRQLCINNDVGMFVTAFLGILDIRTGKLQYSNAGHTPPLIYRYKKGFSWLNVTKNLFLAGMEDTEYATDEIQLTPGDMLLLYTDGVTEAKDKDNNQFTKERLIDVVNGFSAEHMTLDEIIACIKEEIDIFVGSAPQTDDITMLAARYYS